MAPSATVPKLIALLTERLSQILGTEYKPKKGSSGDMLQVTIAVLSHDKDDAVRCARIRSTLCSPASLSRIGTCGSIGGSSTIVASSTRQCVV
jgi:hypothetical protein